jgi:hypothetical protein
MELIAALTAGLIVALGVVGLSHEATNTFNEEIRSASAESEARTAIDRLRADLQRASFMSTPNITRDPSIARPIAQATNVTATETSAFGMLAHLAGVQITVGGSALGTPLSAAQTPSALNPDSIVIAGNFTSTDEYLVRNIDPPSGSCQRVWLAVDSPAMWRILALESGADGGGSGTAGSANAALANAFQPVGIGVNPFFVRVADDTGKFQYVATCPTATGGASGAAAAPWVDIDIRTPILTSQQTGGTGGKSGFGSHTTIAPIQMVKWELVGQTATNWPTAVEGTLNPVGDANKYDLIRSYVDITKGTGAIIAGTQEVVAEYAVDLKFALNVDKSTVTNGQETIAAAIVYPFDDDVDNANWSPDVSTLPGITTGATASTTGPQRIRSVRVRLVTREAVSDRATNIAPSPANTTEFFIYRYCAGQIVTPDGGSSVLPTCPRPGTVPAASLGQVFARARTVTTEVALPNQSQAYFL